MRSDAPVSVPAIAAATLVRPGLNDDPLWYRDAVVYQVHVRGYFDSDGDGVGDFAGLSRQLDYIQSLGVSCLWLQPFYPSPLRDDGYDIASYQGVHPSYGTRRDFRHFLDQAHHRGIRVITELVINHTSDQHPWFQAARRARPGSAKRDYYVWSDTDQKYAGVRIIFTDTERSNWTWDPDAGAYYFHRFFHHQPDLNFDNPQVRKAVMKVMRFWLDMGVDGMRLDAVPYLIEREGTICENLPETHAVLREIRRELDARYRNRMLLAEANQWPADVLQYFGAGDECHMTFHFPLMPRLFMALRQEDRHPITEILNQTPDIPQDCQWAIFLRNHDELTLEMVTDEERDYMYQAYAADPQMRINVGIRRRLAPLMENSRPRIELLNGLLLSLPGTPILYYGDEIGMGDNIYLGDRNGVRTPMQWTADRNAGFSRADPARLYAPVIMDSIYGYQSINVEAQERSPYSLLNWMRRAIALRQRHRTFGRGSMELLYPDNRHIFAFVRRYEDDDPILVVANLSRSMQAVALDLSRFSGLVPVEMSGGTELPKVADAPYFLTLGPYDFYWLSLRREPPSPISVRAGALIEGDEAPSPLLLGPDWTQVLDGSTRTLLERRYLPWFLRRQRWFGTRPETLLQVRVSDWGYLSDGREPSLLAVVAAEFDGGATDHYALPLTMVSGERAETALRDTPAAVIARVAGARKGAILGRLDAESAHALLAAVADAAEIRMQGGRMLATRTSAFARARGDAVAPLPAAPSTAEQSNSSVRFGDRLILKVIRRLWPGANPELQLGRFLTEQAGFTRAPALAGGLTYRDRAGGESTLAVLHELVPHQRDGWRHALADLGLYFDRAVTWDVEQSQLPEPFDTWTVTIPELARSTVGGYLELAAKLGQRTAELHLAFSSPEADRELGTAALERDAADRLVATIAGEASATLAMIAGLDSSAPDAARDAASRLRASENRLQDAIRHAVDDLKPGVRLTRIHGDYHLGQVLLNEEDFTIVDFEGEPARPIEERRRLQSPLKDVAGMLRSFHYATGAALSSEQTLVQPQELERLARWAVWWRMWASTAFLQAYRQTAGDAPFLPGSQRALDDLLRLLLIEKACYEIRYEFAHRPSWIGIPVEGLLELLESPAAPVEGDSPEPE
jgi:maltose alpha-D-glucosyltransferase/alpha-amylase